VVELSFLGQPRIQIEDQPFNLKARKGMALLAYLSANEGQRQSRDVLAALLWPDYDQVRARTNLRRLLYLVNQTPVAGWLETDPEFISLQLDENIVVDVLQFSALLGQETPETLERAIALYQNDFLTDFYLADSSSFEEWTITQRETYRRQALEALDTLTNHYQEEQAYSAAETMARRQLQLDNFRESAWRQLMRALTGQGRRAEALAVYDECRQLLEEELDVEPSAATMALAEELRAGEAGQKSQVARERVITPPLSLEPLLPRTSPYRGLFAFREKDAPNFYGREEFTELLATAVERRRDRSIRQREIFCD
jgi:DNA-binding SARP family transcriptional activator